MNDEQLTVLTTRLDRIIELLESSQPKVSMTIHAHGDLYERAINEMIRKAFHEVTQRVELRNGIGVRSGKRYEV